MRYIIEMRVGDGHSAAAKRAGFIPGSQEWADLANNKHVLRALAADERAQQAGRLITKERIELEMAQHAMWNAADLVDDVGELLPLPLWPIAAQNAVTGFKHIPVRDPDGTTRLVVTPVMSDKQKALDALAKARGMFTTRTEVSGPGGNPIEFVEVLESAAERVKSMRKAVASAVESPSGE
jgi:hypothetical protein